MIEIPLPLKNPAHRFYLIKKNKKVPSQKGWTKTMNYDYDNIVLRTHIGNGKNYGLVCGYGNIIVIDFDSQEYYDKIKDKLPETFTVITAGKQLPHLYYRLTGVDYKIKKMMVDDEQGNRLCDIQTSGCGVVAPGSKIGERFYEPNKKWITAISLDKIKEVFELDDPEEKKEFVGEHKTDNAKKDIALAVLHVCDIRIRVDGNMKCPFHPMTGTGNLSILDSGMIYCFHERTQWWSDQFLSQYKNISLNEAKQIIDLITLLYEEKQNDR